MSTHRPAKSSSWLSQIFSANGMLLFFGGLLGLGILVITSLTTVNGDARRDYLKDRAKDEAAGETYEMTNLIHAPTPDDQNFAMTPLLGALLSYTRDERGVHWPQNEGDDTKQPTVSLSFTNGNSQRTPDMGDWEKQIFTPLADWQTYYRDSTTFPLPEKPGTPAQDVLAALEKFHAQFEELRTACRRPAAYFPIHKHVSENFGMLLPHLAVVKTITRFSRLHAIASLQIGNSDAALDDLRIVFRLLEALDQEPFLVSHLVRYACLSEVESVVWEGLSRHQWRKEDIAALQKLFESIDQFHGLSRSMRGERAAGNAAVLLMISRPASSDAPSPLDEDPIGLGKSARMIPGFMLYRSLININDYYRRTIKLVDGLATAPGGAAAHAKEFDELLERKTARKSWDNVLLRVLAPSLGDAVRKTARSQATVNITVAACALERAKIDQGKYPPTLAALVPKYLSKSVLDPMDLQPLRYRLEADGSYTLYSVGIDGRDDGGVIVHGSKRRKSNSETGDIVWGLKTAEK